MMDKVYLSGDRQYSMSKSENVVQEVQSVGSLYDFQEVLGEGTFASVWRATQRGGDSRRVAIKQVQVHPLEKEMAYRQVQNLQKVESDHIIKYYTSIYDTNESTLNLVMQLCAGSLRGHLANKSYSRSELLSFIAQMNAAFLELLEKKLMHLDLKPQNILIAGRSGNCFKICDFGCAQIAIKSKLSKYDNQTFGTFNYLAPENYLNYHGKLTNTSADIWSLGVILYELMYRKFPFAVDKEGYIDRNQIKAYFQGKEETIKYYPGPPEDVVGLVRKMLRAKPKDRITWVQLKQELLGLGFDEYHFANTKRIYFKHVKTLKIFLTFIVILRKDIDLNPHPFWKTNQATLQELADTLVHLCYLHCLKFDSIYSYKFQEFLQAQWIEDLSFMRRHIEFEEVALARRKEHRISALADLAYMEEVFLNCVREVRERLSDYSQFWVTMQELDIFCQETIRRGELRKSFFAAADHDSYGETMKALDIN